MVCDAFLLDTLSKSDYLSHFFSYFPHQQGICVSRFSKILKLTHQALNIHVTIKVSEITFFPPF